METRFREEDCEVWRQHGSDPGWRAKHKPTGIVISSGHSWQEERPEGMIDGLRKVVERHWEERARDNERHDKLSAEIAAKNGWTVHCRGGCAGCDWQGFLTADGNPIPRMCTNCQGRGEVRQRLRPKYQLYRTCFTCKGSGRLAAPSNFSPQVVGAQDLGSAEK